jgi:hypothetical protein
LRPEDFRVSFGADVSQEDLVALVAENPTYASQVTGTKGDARRENAIRVYDLFVAIDGYV